MASDFPLVDAYIFDQTGTDPSTLTADSFRVLESGRKATPDLLNTFRRPFEWLRFNDGRTGASVVGGLEDEIHALLTDSFSTDCMFDSVSLEQIKQFLNRHFAKRALPEIKALACLQLFAANGKNLRDPKGIRAQRITDHLMARASHISPPEQAVIEGMAYGVVVEGRVVSVAWAHPMALRNHNVGDVNIETDPYYQGIGYARSATYAVAKEIIVRGGEAVFYCDPDNRASIAVAKALGFASYGKSVFGMPIFYDDGDDMTKCSPA